MMMMMIQTCVQRGGASLLLVRTLLRCAKAMTVQGQGHHIIIVITIIIKIIIIALVEQTGVLRQ